MKTFIATDVHVIKANNRFYISSKVSTILKRYYYSFGKIVLCSRTNTVPALQGNYDDISDFLENVIDIGTLTKMLLNKNNDELRESITDCDLVIGRCPSVSAYKAFDIAKKLNKPYLAESMGDAWDAYWNHGILGKLVAPYMYLKIKNVVANADYAVYVTTEFLQNRYPCKKGGIAASNVLLENTSEAILDKRITKIRSFNPKKISLMTAAAIDVRYKGQQYVIKAIPSLMKAGIDVKYRIVGEGKNDFLKGIAQSIGVLDQVEFVGRVPLNQVLDLLDDTDIYLQPSLQEGLPRSVIEAMSRGCVCIGARTAGIPELLQPEFVVPRKSALDIAKVIKNYISKPLQEKEKIALRNWNEAKQYSQSILDGRRREYFNIIKRDILTQSEV